jgi:hypothetical protein
VVNILCSDVVGVVAGLMLAFPHFKDQVYRFRREREKRLAENSPVPDLRQILVDAWESKRLEYDGLDSAILAAGAGALVISFVLKAIGY